MISRLIMVFSMILFVEMGGMAVAQNSAQKSDEKADEKSRNKKAAHARMKARIEKLETQIDDFQIAIGTLKSLAASSMSDPSPASSEAEIPIWGDTTITPTSQAKNESFKVRSLSAQIERLAVELRKAEAAQRGEVFNPADYQTRAKLIKEDPPVPLQTSPPVHFENPVEIVKLMPGKDLPPKSSLPLREPVNGPGAKQLYEQARKQLLAGNYQLAEVSLRQLLKDDPGDDLAGKAHYWLGESLFARRQYRDAANVFLKNYTKYGSHSKASESLLKLALSLRKLGQKDAACSTLSEFRKKFPKAPLHVRQRAVSEHRKVGC